MIDQQSERAYHGVCSKVAKEFYLKDTKLAQWTKSCHQRASQLKKTCQSYEGSVTDCLVQDLNESMAELGVSHLFITSPAETDEVFLHTASDTGIRVRLIEDLFIVVDVLADSPAAKLGIRKGDSILGRDGFELRYPTDVKTSGMFRIKRQETTFEVQVDSEPLNEDVRPKLFDLGDGVGLLKISSFEGQYQNSSLFEKSAWIETAAEFDHFDHIIVDLRENIGGNFVGMLRALSPFYCHPKLIGSIDQPRKEQINEIGFPDFLEADLQIETLETYKSVTLSTFEGYGCFKKRVTVLVDSATASAAEIFAEGIRLRPKTRILGHPTSGSVLVAKREEIESLGSGYVLSIPVATFKTTKNESLESRGVQPDKIIFYDQEDGLDGIDSWIEYARSVPFK